jgi:hypothetical protein
LQLVAGEWRLYVRRSKLICWVRLEKSAKAQHAILVKRGHCSELGRSKAAP